MTDPNDSQTVNFIYMADGTYEEYKMLEEAEHEYVKGLPGRLMQAMAGLDDSFGGYKVSRLEHSLQSATRAHRAGESEEMVVAALLHDIGDVLAPLSHSEYASSILRPFVSEKTHWIVKHHGLFQMYYYAHHYGKDRNARERFKDHEYYEATVTFCEDYDQNCFDPDYDSESLEFFRPMVENIFSRAPLFDTTL